MSVRTRASSAVEEYFDRFISNCDFIYEATTFAFGDIGRARSTPIHVRKRVTIDMIGYVVGATAAGNVRIGLYRRGTIGYPDLPDGGVLIVESGSLAQPGISRVHWATVANTQLAPGLYYLAVQADDVTATFMSPSSEPISWGHNVLGFVRICCYYDHAYGPFTNPCPVTVETTRGPVAFLRVASIP